MVEIKVIIQHSHLGEAEDNLDNPPSVVVTGGTGPNGGCQHEVLGAIAMMKVIKAVGAGHAIFVVPNKDFADKVQAFIRENSLEPVVSVEQSVQEELQEIYERQLAETGKIEVMEPEVPAPITRTPKKIVH